MAWSKSHTEDPQILVAAVRNLGSRSTRCQRYSLCIARLEVLAAVLRIWPSVMWFSAVCWMIQMFERKILHHVQGRKVSLNLRMELTCYSETLLHTYLPNVWLYIPEYRNFNMIYIKVKCSRYRPGVAQRVGRGIALLFHDRGTRRGWLVSSTPRPHFTPRERPGTHFTGGWEGPRAGLDGRKISSPPGFDPGPSSP